jgi:hypothetical protein
MILLKSTIGQRNTWFLAAMAILLPVLHAQDAKDPTIALRVPHTIAGISIDCSNTSAIWENVPRVSLSKKAVIDLPPDTLPPVLDATKPIAAIVQMNDPSKPASRLPPAIERKLDSLHEQYAFQWDAGRLYGYVEITELDWDSGHPQVSDKDFKRSPSEAAASDLFFSSVIVDVGAPSWQRWITEMHVHVRSPKAAPMAAMFFGRTNDEEEFRELPGEAVACPTKGGWIAKFSVAWLPFEDWHPVAGATANVRLVVPLAHAQAGYVLGSVVPFVLTK